MCLRLNTTLFLVLLSDLDHAKFGFYRFESFLFIVAIVFLGSHFIKGVTRSIAVCGQQPRSIDLQGLRSSGDLGSCSPRNVCKRIPYKCVYLLSDA